MKMHCKKARKNISLALDARLQSGASERLQAHLARCPSCREWQQEQKWLLELMKTPQAVEQPSASFYAGLRERIDDSRGQRRFFILSPSSFRPALLRAAMALILVFSALLGFFLSDRFEVPADDRVAADFSQTMNLNAFADLPAESFGEVYERLLRGGSQ